jgi:hypothetical protein
MEKRDRIIELLTAVRYTTNDIEKVADEICLLFGVVGRSEQLPQDKFCKVCNLPTDGEKCYSKRCPI